MKTSILTLMVLLISLPSLSSDPPMKLKGVVAELSQKRVNLGEQSRLLRTQLESLIKATGSSTDMQTIEHTQFRLRDLAQNKVELDAKMEFLSRLILALESEARTSSSNAALLAALKKLIIQESERGFEEGGIGPFVLRLNTALSQIPESKEALLPILFSFMEFSGVARPKSPYLFIERHNYRGRSAEPINSFADSQIPR